MSGLLPKPAGWFCNVEYDIQNSAMIAQRQFTDLRPNAQNLAQQVDINSQLKSLSGFRQYSGRYCVDVPPPPRRS